MRPAIAAFFETPAQVDEAIRRIGQLGVPRDLVEVVVSPRVAPRYAGRARPLGRRVIAYAGAGAGVGLVVGLLGSLVVIALPGYAEPGLLAFVQLLGPNAAIVIGGAAGVAVGLVVRQVSPGAWALAHQRDAILLLVEPGRDEVTEPLLAALRELGALEVRTLTAPPG